MKKFQISLPGFVRINCLTIVLFHISFIVYSQNDGQWILKGDTDPRVSTSSFAEDPEGNILIRSFKQIPPKSLVIEGKDYSSFTCVEENIINIYTPEGEWIDHKTVAKKPGIHTDSGFISFAQYNIPKKEQVFEVRYDNEGQLWMLTTKGILLCKDNRQERFLEDINFEKELYKRGGSYVLGIAGTPEFINKYVITEDKIYYYVNNRFNLLLQMAKKEKIYRGVEGKNNNVWVTTANGILMCNNGIITKYLENIDFEKSSISHPLSPSFMDGFVVSHNTIYKYENDEFVKIKEVLENETYSFVRTDNNGRTWFIKYDDEGENYYISYYKEGIWKEFPQEIISSDTKYSFPNLLYFTPDNKVWLNGRTFIACLEENNFQIIPIDYEKKPKNFLFHQLCFDNKGNVFISCNQSDIPLLDSPKEFGVGGFLIKYGIDSITYFASNRKYSLRNSTAYYSDGYGLDISPEDMFIRNMMVDSRNNLWLVTGWPKKFDPKGQGMLQAQTSIIAKLSDKGTEVFGKSDGINQINSKHHIYEDSKGRIWIGSHMMGVYMYEYND